jgi:hypothetical protein
MKRRERDRIWRWNRARRGGTRATVRRRHRETLSALDGTTRAVYNLTTAFDRARDLPYVPCGVFIFRKLGWLA